MNGVQAILTALKTSEQVLLWQLGDFTDAELLVRPAPGANHVAWQLGHLIAAERYHVLQQFPSATIPDLPPGFAEAHSKDTAGRDGPEGFLALADYRALFSSIRAATIRVVEGLKDDDLDRPTTGPLASFTPTLGAALLILVANHAFMHSGSVSVVRRVLGKPVLF